LVCSKSSSKSSKKNLKHPNPTPKEDRKRRTNKTQIQQKEGNNKIRAEINKRETKETTTSMKSGASSLKRSTKLLNL